MEIEVCSCVRGYHVYQVLWIPVIGEELLDHVSLIFSRLQHFLHFSVRR